MHPQGAGVTLRVVDSESEAAHRYHEIFADTIAADMTGFNPEAAHNFREIYADTMTADMRGVNSEAAHHYHEIYVKIKVAEMDLVNHQSHYAIIPLAHHPIMSLLL